MPLFSVFFRGGETAGVVDLLIQVIFTTNVDIVTDKNASFFG